MAQCPGQDKRFWKPEDIYEVDCPRCKAKVEFWKDDVYRRCKKCGHRFRNPKLDLGCAEWCQYARYCIGQNIKEIEKYAPCVTEQAEVTKAELLRKKDKTMETITTLDLRPMLPVERHQKIFATWDTLKAGQILEVINNHDPRPLKYQFEAEHHNSFEWTYKQEGPTDWVVWIKKVRDLTADNQKVQIKEVLKKLHSAPADTALKEEAKQILRQVGPTELSLLEQELLKEGISRADIMRLCDVHLEVMADNLKASQIVPAAGHPIHTMMEEHKVILEYLNKLQGLIKRFREAKSLDNMQHYLTILAGIAHHLMEVEKHHQREEEVIFPALEKCGISEPPAIMRLEHIELKKRKKSLYELTIKPPDNYEKLLKSLEDAGGYLVRELAKHIFKEDNILYQAALKTLKPEEWTALKKRCDEIGYCCFTPLEIRGGTN